MNIPEQTTLGEPVSWRMGRLDPKATPLAIEPHPCNPSCVVVAKSPGGWYYAELN